MLVGFGIRIGRLFIPLTESTGDPNAAWVTGARIVASFSFAQPGTLPFRVATHAQAATTHIEIDSARRLVITIGGVAHVGACPLWRAGETISGSIVLSVEAGNGTPWVRVRRGSDVDDVVDPYLGALPTMGAVATATTGPTLGAGVTLALGASAWSAAWLLVQRFGLLDAGAFASSPGFTCASGSRTVQTSASTIATGIGVDVDAIGSYDGVTFGAQHEERRANLALARSILDAAYTAGTGDTNTAGQTSPSGDTGAVRVQLTSGGMSRSQAVNVSAGVTHSVSVWARTDTASLHYQTALRDTLSANVAVATLSSSWRRVVDVNAPNGGPTRGNVFSEARGFTNVTAGARDTTIDYPQIEVGSAPSSYHSGTRLGTRRSFAASRLVSAGRYRGRTAIAVGPHASATLSAPVAIASGPNLAIVYTPSTGLVSVTIDGAAQTSAVPVQWGPGVVVRWAWDVGGRAPEVWVSLATGEQLKLLGGGSTQAAVSSVGTIDVLGNAANVDATDGTSARQQSGLLHDVAIGGVPAWTANADVWTPRFLGPSLWLRGDLGVTVDGSNRVSLWADQSGWGRDASQSTLAAQPTRVTSAINSQLAVRFAGTGTVSLGQTHLNGALASFLSTPSAFTVTAIVRVLSYTSGLIGAIAGAYSSVADNSFGRCEIAALGPLYTGGIGPAVTHYHPTLAAHIARASTAANTNMAMRLVEPDSSTSSFTGRINGADVASSAIDGNTYAPAVPNDRYVLGARGGGAYGFNGDLAEVLVMPRTMTAAENTLLAAYVLARYGVTL